MKKPYSLRVLTAMLLAALMMQSCDLREQPANDPIFTMHRALRRDGSAERESEATRLLRCDPCQAFEAPDGTEFLFGRHSEMTIRLGDILAAQIIPSWRHGRLLYMLHLELTYTGTSRLISFVDRHPRTITVNAYQGEALGLLPLSLDGGSYVAARFASEEDAIRVVTEIGVPFRVEDPIPARPIPSA